MNSVLVVIAVLLIVSVPLYFRLARIVTEMAIASARNSVSQSINAAVAARMSRGDLDYGNIVTLERDESGKVAALTTNMSKVNSLKAELVSEIMESIAGKGPANVKVPFGNLLGSHLTTGMGPDITVRIVTASTAYTSFSNKFSAAGINQTRHEILLDVSIDIRAFIAGSSVNATVDTQIVVAETILLGTVPEHYVNFEGFAD